MILFNARLRSAFTDTISDKWTEHFYKQHSIESDQWASSKKIYLGEVGGLAEEKGRGEGATCCRNLMIGEVTKETMQNKNNESSLSKIDT